MQKFAPNYYYYFAYGVIIDGDHKFVFQKDDFLAPTLSIKRTYIFGIIKYSAIIYCSIRTPNLLKVIHVKL